MCHHFKSLVSSMNVYPRLHKQGLDNLNHVFLRCLDQQRSLILTTVGVINIIPFQQEFRTFNVSKPNGISKGSYQTGKHLSISE
jgi:hypothetical protein